MCFRCEVLYDYSGSYFSHTLAHFYLVFVSGGFCQLWRKKEGVFNAPGIHSLFSTCPRGWKAAESSNTDTLPHALHGKNSEIKGFVCTNCKHSSPFVNLANKEG
ncbi:hypothetical protein ILYODFUR_013106 [Ilyodon furcidens]|uniref:Uncharacterized protein n=1 Tax=Ilyodon furcidens TaxID=33524 RepID=A0ABV0TU78_9TELE